MDLQNLRDELTAYYYQHSFYQQCEGKTDNYRNPLWDLMDQYASSHQGLSAVQLKAAQYEIIAENFHPVIFANSPFYSEMGVKIAESNGCPRLSAGGWLFTRKEHLFRDSDLKVYEQYMNADKMGIHFAYGPYVDYDHHCFPYSNVMLNGLGGIYEQAEAQLKHCENRQEAEFIECAMRGLLAVKRISEKFADAAEARLQDTTEDIKRHFLGMIARTARDVPWRKPTTFYEGLCTIWFLHEVCASIEGVGMYVIGHLDRMLEDIYRRDMDAGRLNPDEAYDLLCRFMIYTECKFDSSKLAADSYNLQEMGEVIILGGCDADGREICNDITLMILRAHHEHKMLYPKILCRLTRHTQQEYLDAINRDFVSGRNVIAFLNDECLIPAQVKAGKAIEDARCYVAGGCWEVILEGCEHSAGANCYVNLTRIMDMSINDQPELAAATGVYCDKIDGAEDFEDVYHILMGNVVRVIRQMCMVIRDHGSVWPKVSPAPFFSACLSDCLPNRRDYTAGGGRYNPHGLPIGGFADFVNSLLVIRALCFERQHCTLDDLLKAVRANWEGYDSLRAEVITMPHFGDNTCESNALAHRVLDDIYLNTRDIKNERGGPFQLGLYFYRDIIFWGKITLATPDGRRSGDVLGQGLTPSHLHHTVEITSTINSGASLDLTKCPANSVLTVSLPLGGVNLQTLGSFERAFVASGIGMLQMNCVDKAQLLDARLHPECHHDLIVRLYGYSARFVNLTAEMQEEFISRNIYGEMV